MNSIITFPFIFAVTLAAMLQSWLTLNHYHILAGVFFAAWSFAIATYGWWKGAA